MKRTASLAAFSLLLSLAGAVLAASGFVPQFREAAGVGDCQPEQCGPDYHVVARAEDISDDRILAYNVVVTEGVGNQRIAAIANGLRESHPKTRVIVYIFDEASAALHFGFGLLPTDDVQPAPGPRDRAGWLATFDYMRSGRVREIWGQP